MMVAFAHCAVNILVHISLVEMGDFPQGVYAGVEWLGECCANLFQAGCIVCTLSLPCMHVPWQYIPPTPRPTSLPNLGIFTL